jgi:hypothetical protein
MGGLESLDHLIFHKNVHSIFISVHCHSFQIVCFSVGIFDDLHTCGLVNFHHVAVFITAVTWIK